MQQNHSRKIQLMTSVAMFWLPCKKRWRTFNSDWRNELTWSRKWLFEKPFLRYRKQLRKTESRTSQAERQIQFTMEKTLWRCEKECRTSQRKCKIEKMNRKIVRKNSRAWMTKCRMIARLQAIEVWNFIWWTNKRWIMTKKHILFSCWMNILMTDKNDYMLVIVKTSRLINSFTRKIENEQSKKHKWFQKDSDSLNDCVKIKKSILKN